MRRFMALFALLGVAAAGCSDEPQGEITPADGRFNAQRALQDLRAQVRIGPRPAGSAGSRREVRLIVRRLREAGVRGIRVQHPDRNVVGRIPGEARSTVVVGAHHDTKDIPGFVGANDGASAVAVLLELARALPRRLEGPSIQLVFFDAEEPRGDRPFDLDGARGSRQFVRYARRGGRQGSPALGEIQAMVLFDLVGDCKLSLPREGNSDPGLHQLFADAAQGLSGDTSPFAGTTAPILDDHIPFAEAGIPAVGLIDFEFGPGPSPGAFWHSRRDNLGHVCAASLDAVGETALIALPRIR